MLHLSTPAQISQINIPEFMINSLNIPSEQAADLHQQYMREFGSTIEGLIY